MSGMPAICGASLNVPDTSSASRARLREQLLNDEDHQYAISKALELIGESVRQLSPDLRAAYPAIPWSKIEGMRDFLAHSYHRADWNIVWETITTNIPILLATIEPLIAGTGQDKQL